MENEDAGYGRTMISPPDVIGERRDDDGDDCDDDALKRPLSEIEINN